MTPLEVDECFDCVHELILKCGDVLRDGFKNTGVVKTKAAAHEVVTFWDSEIEKVLMNGIKKKYPEHKFIAEEDSSEFGENSLTANPTWIIDPIDGTMNFVQKLHFVCISVALVIEGELRMAFLYNPMLNELYTAKKGEGAFLNGERIEASKKEELSQCILAHEISIGAIPEWRPKYVDRAIAFLERCRGLRSLGSAALTLGYVAKGALDAFNIEDLKPWDIAAGALIIQEAGGVVMASKGGKYNIMKPDVIVAGTLKVANELKEIISAIDLRLESEGKLPEQLLKLRLEK